MAKRLKREPSAHFVTKYTPSGNRHVLRGEAYALSSSVETTVVCRAGQNGAHDKQSRVYGVGEDNSSESEFEIISTVREIVNAVSDDKKPIYTDLEIH